jgi:hypothetical protein
MDIKLKTISVRENGEYTLMMTIPAVWVRLNNLKRSKS